MLTEPKKKRGKNPVTSLSVGFENRDAFHRPDGALERALAWLGQARSPVLYLSGASGAGKTSLLAAGIAPALREARWSVVMVRGMAAPLASLTDALRASSELYRKPPAQEGRGARPAAPGRRGATAGRHRSLLVVLDQFEEYLILSGGEAKPDYIAFLRELAAAPPAGVRLLHVFRSDYRALLFKHGLPRGLPAAEGENRRADTGWS